MKRDSFAWADLLRLQNMVSPKLILLIYWLGCIALLLSALGRIYLAFSGVGDGLKGVAATVLGALLVFLCWRVLCELAVLAFGIHARLGALLNQKAEPGSAAADSSTMER